MLQVLETKYGMSGSAVELYRIYLRERSCSVVTAAPRRQRLTYTVVFRRVHHWVRSSFSCMVLLMIRSWIDIRTSGTLLLLNRQDMVRCVADIQG